MNIKIIVLGLILGVALHYAAVALGLLVSYLIDKLFSHRPGEDYSEHEVSK